VLLLVCPSATLQGKPTAETSTKRTKQLIKLKKVMNYFCENLLICNCEKLMNLFLLFTQKPQLKQAWLSGISCADPVGGASNFLDAAFQA
jgi:hypothetical protein